MGKIIEFITVNVATRDPDATLAKWKAMGLANLAPVHMPAPPAEITDVTLPIGPAGAVSVISPTGPGSPVQRFLEKRGEGAYSIAVRVDSLEDVMRDWTAAGLAWVLPEPYEFPPGNAAGRYRPERLKANWVRPNSLGGVMLEVFEFIGRVEILG
ncbi:MAG TPA: VOC family protein [Stellaceae bacterium]|nr:VOC family protein [Stellaceae bacterium]